MQDIDREVAWNHPNNRDVYSLRLADFEVVGFDAPTGNEVSQLARSDYASNFFVIGPHAALVDSDITDGESNTLLLGEASTAQKPWGHPANWRDPSQGLNASATNFSSPWKSTVNFSMCDGSVRQLDKDISPEVLKALATPHSADDIRNIFD